MGTVLHDLRFAFRQLRKSPGFTTVAVLTLALGIGANTAAFSVLYLDLLHPLPYPNADRLISFGMLIPSYDSRSFLFTSSYLQLADSKTPFESVTSWRPGVAGCDLTETQPLRLACARVESSFLPTFGIHPVVGSNFTTEEDGPNAPPVCLISYTLWQRRFAGNPAVLGQTFSLDGQPVRVQGILPANFEWPTLVKVDVLLPEALSSAERTNPLAGVVRAYARLKPRVNLETARSQLTPALETWRSALPPMFRNEARLGLISLREDQIGSIRLTLEVLFAASLALMLLACANVANMLLARRAAREQELAVRAALGATRRSLIFLQLSESVVLGLLGGLIGAAIAFSLLHIFAAVAPAGIPRLSAANLGIPVLLFTLAIALLAGIVCGLLATATIRPLRALVSSPSLRLPRTWLRTALIVGQVAVSFALVNSAGLLLTTLRNLEDEAIGIDTNHIVTAEVTLGRATYGKAPAAAEFFDRLETGLRNLPGVTAVAVSDSLPPTGSERARRFSDIQVEGRPGPPQQAGGLIGWRIVSPSYFQALNIPILEGRAFTADDQAPQSNAVVLSKKLAERLFPHENAIGQYLQLSAPPGSWYTIVGVAGDVKYLNDSGRAARIDPEYYVPHKSGLDPSAPNTADLHAFFLVRSPLRVSAVQRLVRDEIASLDPTLPANISTLDGRVDLLRVQPRFNATLISLFAVVGLALAALGLYGVLSFLVSLRTMEIGVRMALGAEPRSILRMFVWRGLELILVGLASGIIMAFLTARLLQGLLYGVSSQNIAVPVAAGLLLLTVGFAASYIPARRAAKVDPMEALRYE